MKKWDIYLANVRFDDDKSRYKERPVLIIEPSTLLVLSFKITTHEPRRKFRGEYSISNWKAAGLLKPSVVRCSQVIDLSPEDIYGYIGRLSRKDIEELRKLVKKELPEYAHLVERFVPDDSPEFDRVIF